MANPIQFNEDFIPRITAGGVSRGEALSSTSLVDVQANRTDIPSGAVEKRVKFLNDLGFGDITLGEIKEGGPKRDEFIKAIVAYGKDTRSGELVGDFTKILGEVGVTAARGANPFRAMMKEAVGEADYLKAGFSTAVDRKIPLAYPPEVYTEVKSTVAGLLTSDDPLRKEAGVRMLLMMQGGYRPSDFKGLKIENINFETGIVKGLALKTDSKDNIEGAGKKSVPIAYMPSSQRDVILHHIGDRKNGMVFTNSASSLDKLINEELAKASIPLIEYYSEGTDSYVKEKFSAYDFRRLMETHLSAQGYNETSTVRRALTWRPQEGNVQKYQAILNEAGRIEQANAASFQTWVLMSEGNAVLVPAAKNKPKTRVRTHGQFLTEVGIDKISPYTARYAVTGEAVNNLPPFMQERAQQLSEGVVFSNDNIAPISIETDDAAAQTYQKTSKTKAETALLQAEIDKRDTAARLAGTPEVTQTSVPTPAAADVDEPNIEVQNKLTEEGFDSKGMADAMKEYQKTGKMPSGTKGVVGTVVGVAGTVASKGAKAALSTLPGVGFESTRRELIERGETPEKAAGQAFVEEASGAMGIIGPASRALTDLTISGTEKALEQQYGIKGDLTDESLEDILTRLISGGRMASGGFIEKGD
jgi:integrase